MPELLKSTHYVNHPPYRYTKRYGGWPFYVPGVIAAARQRKGGEKAMRHSRQNAATRPKKSHRDKKTLCLSGSTKNTTKKSNQAATFVTDIQHHNHKT